MPELLVCVMAEAVAIVVHKSVGLRKDVFVAVPDAGVGGELTPLLRHSGDYFKISKFFLDQIVFERLIGALHFIF